jgi:hypothetical protein
VKPILPTLLAAFAATASHAAALPPSSRTLQGEVAAVDLE